MKLNFSLFDLSANDFGVLFFQTTYYVEEKLDKNSTYTANAKMPILSSRNGKRRPANAKNGGKIVVIWSLLPFAFHVKRDASSF